MFKQFGVMLPTGDVVWDEDMPREEAELDAKARTQRTKAMHVAVEREIQMTPWRPVVGGIVPPFIPVEEEPMRGGIEG